MNSLNSGGIEVQGITKLEGPLLVIEGVEDVAYDEIVEITGQDGIVRRGNVLEAHENFAVVEVFSGTGGLSAEGTKVRFTGSPLHVPVSKEMLGRVFNSFAEPIDKYPLPIATKFMDVNGQIINPASRVYPDDYLQTGISAIDIMNTLIMGQKLPVFSGAGLPHDQLAAQIVRQAQVGHLSGSKKQDQSEFSIVFAAMGVKHDVAEYFREEFLRSGAINQVAMFLNLADDPTIERLLTPRSALTLAEYLA